MKRGDNLKIWIKENGAWNKGKKMSDEYRERCRRLSIGRKVSLETKLKMSLAQKKIGNRPPINWGNKFCLGRPTSQKQKDAMSKRVKGKKYALGNRHTLSEEIRAKRRGQNNWRWISDRSLLKRYKGSEEKRSPAYKYWRTQINRRDNFKCRIADNNCEGRLEVHHILSWRDFVELRYQINNGITLCHAHHPRKRAEEKRLIPVFQELVSVSNK